MLGKDKEKNKGVLEWLKHVEFDEENGEIAISGQRHALVFNGIFADLRERMRAIIGHSADVIIYEVGREHVKKVLNYYLQHYPPLKLLVKTGIGKEQLAKKAAELLTAYGFGKAEIEKLDLENESIITLKNSFVASFYKKRNLNQDRPVCSLVAGFIAGAAEVIGNGKYECKEIECIAKGDEVCRFVVTKVKD